MEVLRRGDKRELSFSSRKRGHQEALFFIGTTPTGEGRPKRKRHALKMPRKKRKRPQRMKTGPHRGSEKKTARERRKRKPSRPASLLRKGLVPHGLERVTLV